MAFTMASGDGPPSQRLALDFQGTELDGGWAKVQHLSLVVAKVMPRQSEVDANSDQDKQDLGEICSADFSWVEKG